MTQNGTNNMPTIFRPKQKRTYKCATANHEIRQKVYKSEKWMFLRANQLHKAPLCEICEIEGVIREADDVHHVHWISDAPHLAFNPDNLSSLCKKHHGYIHSKTGRFRKSPLYKKYMEKYLPLLSNANTTSRTNNANDTDTEFFF
jgi:5-methylcytosine-specific restriction endonuclease McrA